jgi:hypothetical protein
MAGMFRLFELFQPPPDQLIGSFRFLGRPLLVTSVTRSV